ncbi:ATP-binding cassette domain-containing protein [Rhizobium sp. GCM10022189]|uniref:ATP-binding cassette domain-containing protein n=1 Tax=Rhizobium sp. GCM10022189 TaxID=3252654 RepID=UPI003610156B
MVVKMTVENLAFSFPQGERSLEDISFVLEAGDVICVLGPNGAGKTTLIRCIMGALAVTRGNIAVEGIPARSLGSRQFAAKVAHVPQSTDSVFGHLVRDIVLMGRSPHLGMMEAPGGARSQDRRGVPGARRHGASGRPAICDDQRG